MGCKQAGQRWIFSVACSDRIVAGWSRREIPIKAGISHLLGCSTLIEPIKFIAFSKQNCKTAEEKHTPLEKCAKQNVTAEANSVSSAPLKQHLVNDLNHLTGRSSGPVLRLSQRWVQSEERLALAQITLIYSEVRLNLSWVPRNLHLHPGPERSAMCAVSQRRHVQNLNVELMAHRSLHCITRHMQECNIFWHYLYTMALREQRFISFKCFISNIFLFSTYNIKGINNVWCLHLFLCNMSSLLGCLLLSWNEAWGERQQQTAQQP